MPIEVGGMNGTNWCFHTGPGSNTVWFNVKKKLVYNYDAPTISDWNIQLAEALYNQYINNQVVYTNVPPTYVACHYVRWVKDIVVPAFQGIQIVDIVNYFMSHPNDPTYMCRIGPRRAIMTSQEAEKKGLVGLYAEWNHGPPADKDFKEIPLAISGVCNLTNVFPRKNKVTIEAIPRK